MTKRRVILGVAFLLTFLLGLGAGAGGKEEEAAAPAATAKTVTVTSEAETVTVTNTETVEKTQTVAAPEPEPEATIPGDGTFLIGEDIQPGTYQTSGGDLNCYWARLSGTSGGFEEIITNGNTSGPTTVTIAASDVAFTTTGCNEWQLR